MLKRAFGSVCQFGIDLLVFIVLNMIWFFDVATGAPEMNPRYPWAVTFGRRLQQWRLTRELRERRRKMREACCAIEEGLKTLEEP